MRILYLIGLLFLISPVFAENQFLIVTDIHYGADNKPTADNDTGPVLLASMLGKFKKLSQQADFILNLGDLPTHMLLSSPKKGDYERALFHALYKADVGHKPMFYIPGNNDSLAGNYQAFSMNGTAPLSYAAEWTGACVFCKGLMIDDSNMNAKGYYSSYVMPDNKDIILIALNSAPFVSLPLFVSSYPNQDKDAKAEFLWLERQLKTHTAKQLLIAMHVPPGMNYKGRPFWYRQYLKQFTALLDQYKPAYQEITLLTGHTHMDELRAIPLQQGKTVYNYSTPAISRIHHNNPGMKIISLNKDLEVENYTTYYSSKVDHWADEYYQAMGGADAVFPECHHKTLAACLNSLNTKQVCTDLEKGLFYGAKSVRVPNGACKYTYLVE